MVKSRGARAPNHAFSSRISSSRAATTQLLGIDEELDDQSKAEESSQQRKTQAGTSPSQGERILSGTLSNPLDVEELCPYDSSSSQESLRIYPDLSSNPPSLQGMDLPLPGDDDDSEIPCPLAPRSPSPLLSRGPPLAYSPRHSPSSISFSSSSRSPSAPHPHPHPQIREPSNSRGDLFLSLVLFIHGPLPRYLVPKVFLPVAPERSRSPSPLLETRTTSHGSPSNGKKDTAIQDRRSWADLFGDRKDASAAGTMQKKEDYFSNYSTEHMGNWQSMDVTMQGRGCGKAKRRPAGTLPPGVRRKKGSAASTSSGKAQNIGAAPVGDPDRDISGGEPLLSPQEREYLLQKGLLATEMPLLPASQWSLDFFMRYFSRKDRHKTLHEEPQLKKVKGVRYVEPGYEEVQATFRNKKNQDKGPYWLPVSLLWMNPRYRDLLRRALDINHDQREHLLEHSLCIRSSQNNE